MLGNVEAWQQHFATALPHFQKAAELEPKNPVALVIVSVCAERAGRKQQALDYAKRTTAVSPAFVGGWIQLARVERALAHSQETLAALNRAAGLLPDNAYILATVGYGYINLNKIPEAIPPLQHAAKISPKDFLVQSQLGYCLQATGRIDAAIDHLKKGASLNKNYGPVWDHLGVAYQKQGRHRDAVKAFERATQIMPTYRLSWQRLAQEYRALGQTANADRAASRAQSLPAPASGTGAKKKG
jgi:superkiller protein 3